MNSARTFSRVARILRNSCCTRPTAAAHYHCNAALTLTKPKLQSQQKQQHDICRLYSNQTVADSCLDSVTYERVCSETLDALSDYFDELTENASELTGSDVAYGDGVLTVNLGENHGIYVINRQTPNKQIWLSSPTSGPKRFDFVAKPGNAAAISSGPNGKWIYKHSGESLHQLLQIEIAKIMKTPVDFMQLPYCS